MKFSQWLGNITLVIVAVCASITTSLVVRRELFPSASPANRRLGEDEWKTIVTGGTLIGSTAAPVTILVFSDYQCPYCKSLSTNLDKLRVRYRKGVTISVRHFPLENIHPYAYEAALLAECAAEMGRFEIMDSTLFRHQDEISPNKWGSFGARAGIADTVQLLACVKGERFAERVRSDIALGERLGVQGTPAVFVNRDELAAGAPTLVTLDSIAKRAILRAR